MGDEQTTGLNQFYEAKKKYRLNAENLTFSAYANVVTPAVHDTTKLMKQARESSSAKQRAVVQQALDAMQASKRAVDLRNKSFLDHVADAKSARPHYDSYEASRLTRFKNEQM